MSFNEKEVWKIQNVTMTCILSSFLQLREPHAIVLKVLDAAKCCQDEKTHTHSVSH